MAPSRVTKKRSDSTKQPIQYWDGKTYACMACKRGHRVKLCDHGKDGKLVSATNQPGRPSSGSDRKCTCPKSCKCTTNCKCLKEGCICVQRMFLLVALKSRPKPVWINQDPEPIPQWTDENGEQKTLNPVYTDLNGNLLSPEQAKAREEERERRRNEEMERPQRSGCCSSKPEKSGCCSSQEVEKEAGPTPASSTGCRHRETVPQTPLPQKSQTSIPSNADSRCTCGIKCQCTLCPEHPNNTATRQYNTQQLTAMASNPNGSYMPTQALANGQLFKPEVPRGSCLGGEASYFLTREQPTLHDFQRLFPDYAPGDFVLTYPMDAPTHTYNHMNNMSSAQFTPSDPLYTAQMPMLTDTLPGFDHFDTGGFDDMNFLDQTLDFTFGDANVTTFGTEPLESPGAYQSSMQQRNNSDLPDDQAPAQMDHAAIPTSQTISPSALQSPTPHTPHVHQLPYQNTPPIHVQSTNHDLFFDNILAVPPENLQFDVGPASSDIPPSQSFEYSYKRSSIDPVTSEGFG